MVKRKTDQNLPTDASIAEKSAGTENASKNSRSSSSGKAVAVRNGETKKAPSAKKTAAKKPAAKNGEKEPSLAQKIRQFFREVRIELKKVTWPTRKETIASTSVVLVLVFLVAVYLGLVDFGLSSILKVLLR